MATVLNIEEARKLHPRVKITKEVLEAKPYLAYPKCKRCGHYFVNMKDHTTEKCDRYIKNAKASASKTRKAKAGTKKGKGTKRVRRAATNRAA